jgi:hypothetical protein
VVCEALEAINAGTEMSGGVAPSQQAMIVTDMRKWRIRYSQLCTSGGIADGMSRIASQRCNVKHRCRKLKLICYGPHANMIAFFND